MKVLDESFQNGWGIGLKSPIEGRTEKPRSAGLTMVIDKGLGLTEITDLLEVNWPFIDFLKISFGTSLLYSDRLLKEKIELIKGYDIDPYPGGTLFEVAVVQDKINEYFHKAKELGFTALEISDGTIDLPSRLREEAIYKAKSIGFIVLTEVGKKDRQENLSLTEIAKQIEADLSAGVDYIIIEGRESGKGISIYDFNGSIDIDMFTGIIEVVQGKEEIIIWEAPLKKQQVFLIRELGTNVNFGNIQPGEVLALEALRRGLRGDTFKFNIPKKGKGSIIGA